MDTHALVLFDEIKSLSSASCPTLKDLIGKIEQFDCSLAANCNWIVAAMESGSSSLVQALLAKDIDLPPQPTLSFSMMALWSKIFVQKFLFEPNASDIGVDMADVLFAHGSRCTPDDLQKDVGEIERYFGVSNPPVHFINPLASLVVFGHKKMQKEWDDQLWQETIKPLAELLFYSGCDPRPAATYLAKNDIHGNAKDVFVLWSSYWQQNEIGFAVDPTGDVFTEVRASRRM